MSKKLDKIIKSIQVENLPFPKGFGTKTEYFCSCRELEGEFDNYSKCIQGIGSFSITKIYDDYEKIFRYNSEFCLEGYHDHYKLFDTYKEAYEWLNEIWKTKLKKIINLIKEHILIN